MPESGTSGSAGGALGRSMVISTRARRWKRRIQPRESLPTAHQRPIPTADRGHPLEGRITHRKDLPPHVGRRHDAVLPTRRDEVGRHRRCSRLCTAVRRTGKPRPPALFFPDTCTRSTRSWGQTGAKDFLATLTTRDRVLSRRCVCSHTDPAHTAIMRRGRAGGTAGRTVAAVIGRARGAGPLNCRAIGGLVPRSPAGPRVGQRPPGDRNPWSVALSVIAYWWLDGREA